MEHAKLIHGLEDEAHLWLTRVGGDEDPSVLSSWWDVLSEEERERHGAFLRDDAKLQYLTAWALARTSLSRYADIEPRAWRFQRGKHGRPEIVPPDDAPADATAVASTVPQGFPRLRFNLSHSGGLVACLVTLGVDVGVDVEDTSRNLDMVRLAGRFFSADEAGEIGAVTGRARRERFFAYWTLKEAYIKALGRGLSIPLRQVSFRIAEDGTISARFDPKLKDRGSDWQFEVLRPLRNHLLAVAIRRGQHLSESDGRVNGSGRGKGDRRHLSIVARQVVPLLAEGEVESLPVLASTRR
jgi:4'-phosphopantetheinyl transferase